MMAWKTIKYKWQWQYKSSPEQLWPYVADTQRFNQATKLPAIEFTEIPQETGGSQRIGRTSKLGISIRYEDYPFEWIKDQEFSNVRVFEQGPLARIYTKLTLQPNEAGTCLTYFIEVTPANLLGLLAIPYQFGRETKRNFERVFGQIDDYVQNQAKQPFALKAPALNGAQQARLTALTRQLAAQGHELRLVQYLAEVLINEADINLARMRPYVLADAWHVPRRDVVELFLSAAKLGLLNMRWDIMCPLCRGAKATSLSLDEVRKGVHCPTCNIDFEANFTENVELTFTSHAQIRTVHDDTYCIGGPMVTPHILMHQLIEPGETRTLPLKLKPGGYRVRTQRPGLADRLELDQNLDTVDTLSIRADVDSISVKACPHQSDLTTSQEESTSFIKPVKVVMTNQAPYLQQFYVERAEWYTNAVTAAYVTTLQHFRDLFSDEVLRPGEEIGVQGLTILFSDLIGSTAMYNRWGDASSYSLVREQFAFLQGIVRQYEGAIVKTIGDAIMAAFSDPADGVGAALAIQKEVDSFNADHPDEPLRIKLGLHHGPCIAVTLNGRLDYFGATVNLAARLEGQSQGQDVVISEKLRHDPAVAQLLESSAVNITRFETAVKGFDEPFCLYRLTHRDNSRI
jgi:class 3 adenylate cyclase